MREIENTLRIASGKPPLLWCDFNARGWSGSPEDNCFYVVGPGELEKLKPFVGMKVLLYMDNIACDASLEQHEGAWRARPVGSTWRDVTLADLEKL